MTARKIAFSTIHLFMQFRFLNGIRKLQKCNLITNANFFLLNMTITYKQKQILKDKNN